MPQKRIKIRLSTELDFSQKHWVPKNTEQRFPNPEEKWFPTCNSLQLNGKRAWGRSKGTSPHVGSCSASFTPSGSFIEDALYWNRVEAKENSMEGRSCSGPGNNSKGRANEMSLRKRWNCGIIWCLWDSHSRQSEHEEVWNPQSRNANKKLQAVITFRKNRKYYNYMGLKSHCMLRSNLNSPYPARMINAELSKIILKLQ